ncbi:MAG: serine/threonine-protein kinase [Vicinamibacterales bacterium]
MSQPGAAYDDDRLRAVFDAALEQPPDEREAYLDAACAGAPALRGRVARMLAASARMTSFLERPPADLPRQVAVATGRRVGPYEIVREIGRGGMGAVYLARRADRQFERDVAIKVLAAPSLSGQSHERFRQEQQVLARLIHPNIAQLYDAGTDDDGLAYVVMELVEGEPIDRYCRRTTPAVADRLRLVAAVCDAVAFAHRNLVVHRDLKPSNIMVTADGTVKLLDFGIAKLLDADAAPGDATRSGAQPMTPEYAAPEQVLGQAVTTSTDVYALGLLLFELLTGRRAQALSTSSYDEIVQVVCRTDPVAASAAVLRADAATAGLPASVERLHRTLAGDLDTVVAKALAKAPERRYAGAADLAADLRRYLDGQPIAARPDSAAYRARLFVRRHALPVSFAAAAVVALAGGLGAALWQARVATAARLDADQQRARAEQRFTDLRALATGFVFEFHDAIARLPGATAARALVVRKGLDYLDGLAKDAAGDRSLQADLAAAYERMAELQTNPYEANVGDVAGGLASSTKALEIRDALAASTPPGSPDRLAAVSGYLRLGDALQGGGRTKEAVAAYRRVLDAGEAALTGGGDLRAFGLPVGTAANRLCALLLATGDAAGGLAACDTGLARLTALQGLDSSNVAVSDGLAALRVARANALRVNGRPEEALAEIGRSVSAFRDRVAAAPGDARLQQQLATILTQQGVTQLALGKDTDALASNAEAVTLYEALRARDPGNARVSTILSFILLRQAPVLVRAGRVADAEASTRRGLAIMRAQATRPGAGAGEKNDYASWLLSCEPASLRDPQTALRLAREAVAAERSPIYLDTLALALFQTGDPRQAVEVATAAVALLPPAPSGAPASGLRAEVEGHLRQYREALGKR